MQTIHYNEFEKNLETNFRARKPVSGLVELTFRCNLDCIHCYCKGSQNKGRELSADQWKKIFDQLADEGCLWLTLSGGEPFYRKEFLEIYAYARQKGFLISIFTNGTILPREVLSFFKHHPPLLIEVSLYGTHRKIHEAVTQVAGSFGQTMDNIDRLIKARIPLFLKTVGLKQNREEILRVKALAGRRLGKQRFKFNPLIIPRLDGDTGPCRFRLSPGEILEIVQNDPDMETELTRELGQCLTSHRPNQYLYRCNIWWMNFFINPYGRVQFCHLTRKISGDLAQGNFRDIFYEEFAKVGEETFHTNLQCQQCDLRDLCYRCPSRCFLETGDEEAPVLYYCQEAEAKKKWLTRRAS